MTTIQACNQADGHWFECSQCNHVGTAPNLPEMIRARHNHLRENHPEKWLKA